MKGLVKYVNGEFWVLRLRDHFRDSLNGYVGQPAELCRDVLGDMEEHCILALL